MRKFLGSLTPKGTPQPPPRQAKGRPLQAQAKGQPRPSLARGQPRPSPAQGQPRVSPAQGQPRPGQAKGQTKNQAQQKTQTKPKAKKTLASVVRSMKHDRDKAPHSRAFMKSFRPVRLFLQAFGRFPYRSIQNDDGTCTFSFRHKSPATLVFYATTGIAGVMFLMINVGFLSLFLGSRNSNYHDKCDHTWESLTLFRYIVIVSLVYSWLILTFVSSIDTFFRANTFVAYLNAWSKSVQSMDMNVIKGATWTGMSGNIEFLIVVILLTILFAAGLVPSLQDGLAVTATAMVRTFVVDGICMRDEGGFLTDNETTAIRENKNELCSGRDTSPCGSSQAYLAGKIVGFLLMVYGLYGSRSSIVQFKFFCRLLRNASYIWNQRFRNYKNGGNNLRGDAQDRKRCDVKSLLKDHLAIVQLFKTTQEIFNLILKFYYAIQVINIVMQLYFFAQLTYPVSCEAFWEATEEKYNCTPFSNHHKQERMKMREGLDGRLEQTRSFSDPCVDEESLLVQNAVAAFFIMFQTIILFIDTTLDGTLAHEEAMRGFEILRRTGFINCKDKHERNFIHSLTVSFARTNPIILSAGGYADLDRRLMIGVLAAAFGYWIIIIQFRPGEISVEIDRDIPCPDNCTGCCFQFYFNQKWPGPGAFNCTGMHGLAN